MSESKNIHSGHRERMRKKFIKLGFDGFESHEILELLLFYSIPQRNTNETAHRLMNKYKSITAICNADLYDLMSVEGIGETSAVLLKMIPLLSRKYISDNHTEKILLDSGKAACDYFKEQFIGEITEKMRIVCLNDQLEIMTGKVLFEGIPGSVNIDIRMIAEYTYQNKCENIILAHNHPNGLAMPSGEDIRSNAMIYKALKNIGINLLDHIIVADKNAISMSDTGAFSFL